MKHRQAMLTSTAFAPHLSPVLSYTQLGIGTCIRPPARAHKLRMEVRQGRAESTAGRGDTRHKWRPRPAAALLFSSLIFLGAPDCATSFITPPPSQMQPATSGGSPAIVRNFRPELRPQLRMAAEDVVEEHVKINAKDGVFVLTPKDKRLEEALLEMMSRSPTPDPGDWKDDSKTAKLASGKWEVAYAPHISSLQKLILMDFGPIRYNLGQEGSERTIVSNVQYKSPLWGQGWFNAAGTYSSISSSKVRINFDKFWWDRTLPSPSPTPSSPPKTVVQALGKAGFIPAFSSFPVKYLDERTCVFEFELSGTSILARKLLP